MLLHAKGVADEGGRYVFACERVDGVLRVRHRDPGLNWIEDPDAGFGRRRGATSWEERHRTDGGAGRRLEGNAMLVIFVSAAIAAAIPQADIKKICQTAQVDSLPEDRANALRGCIADEQSAKDQLRQEWGRFSSTDRANCVETPGMQFSYVELLTCLEMQKGGNFATPAGGAGSPAPIAPLTKPGAGSSPDDPGQKP